MTSMGAALAPLARPGRVRGFHSAGRGYGDVMAAGEGASGRTQGHGAKSGPPHCCALPRRRAGCTIPHSRDFSACDLGPRFAPRRSSHGAGLDQFKDLHPLTKLPAHPGPARGSFGGQRRETYSDVILRELDLSR
jgi:hypothetical protein